MAHLTYKYTHALKYFLIKELEEIFGIEAVQLSFFNEKGIEMQKLSLPNNTVTATVSVLFKDVFGHPVAVPTNLAVAVSDPTVVTATVADGVVTITRVGTTGKSDVSVAEGSVTATLEVDLVEPVLASMEFDVTSVKLVGPAV